MSNLSINPTTPGQAAMAVEVAQARERWRVEIEKEVRARGATADEAAEAFEARARDFERCRRSNHTAAQAVSYVIGNWADRTA